jgi:hypothetical protein
MAGSSIDVVLRLRGQRQFAAGAQSASRSVDRLGRSSHTAGRGLEGTSKGSDRARRGFLAVGRAAKYGAFALGGFTLVAGKRSVEAASNLEEQLAKTGTVFGRSGGDIHDWSKGLSLAFGVSRREALETAGTFGNMLVPMGNSRKRAAEMSKTLVQLGSDMSSFNNVSMEQSMGAISSGLAGESEPLRRLGVDIRDAALSEFALAKGIKKTTQEMSSAEKGQLIYRKLLADSKDAQGDMARTGGSWANVQKKLSAVTEDLGAKLGKKLVPFLEKGGIWAAKFIDQMERGKGPGAEFAKTAEGIWKGVKPVAIWFGRAIGKVAKFAGEHPKLVAFGVALFGIKKAAGGLTPSLFKGGGLRGGSGFIGGFKGGMGQFFGVKFGQYLMTRYGAKFKLAGASVGATLGTSAGTTAATTTAATSSAGVLASSRKGGKLAGGFTRAGGMLGPLMGAAIAIPMLAELGRRVDAWKTSVLSGINSAAGGNKATGDALQNGPAGKLLDYLNPLDSGLVKMPWEARGGTARRGGLAMVGERGPEMIYQPPAASVVPLEHEALRGLGGGGGDIVIRHQSILDGRVVAESVQRHQRAARARG